MLSRARQNYKLLLCALQTASITFGPIHLLSDERLGVNKLRGSSGVPVGPAGPATRGAPDPRGAPRPRRRSLDLGPTAPPLVLGIF